MELLGDSKPVKFFSGYAIVSVMFVFQDYDKAVFQALFWEIIALNLCIIHNLSISILLSEALWRQKLVKK